jgi:hypothetical protein
VISDRAELVIGELRLAPLALRRELLVGELAELLVGEGSSWPLDDDEDELAEENDEHKGEDR